MNTELLPVQIHLPGILKVLGENLYSRPEVALREMIQNAHDACTRRIVEDGSFEGPPRIDVSTDERSRTLRIVDNGSGLTRDEIVSFLATIGRGYTGELKESLQEADKVRALELIGQFGLGLLSAFLIARRIEIRTHSFRSNDQHRYVSNGGSSYTLEPHDYEPIGTECLLHLSDDFEYLADPVVITNVIREYALLLPIPIHLNGAREPINCTEVPWRTDAPPRDAYATFVERWFGSEPLAVIPLSGIREGSEDIPMEGALFIPDRSVISLQEHGELVVYIRNMFICANDRWLLPPWAKFVSGIIDCPMLTPTASRESIRQDDLYETIQAALEVTLLNFIQETAANEPSLMARIVENHNSVIKGRAIQHEVLFREVKDLVTFETNQGRMALPEYLRHNDRAIYYSKEDLGNRQVGMLFDSLDLQVIDARWFAEEDFLEVYAAFIGHGLRLIPCDEAVPGLLHRCEVPPENPGQEDLRAFFKDRGMLVKLAHLPSRELPLFLHYPRSAKLKHEVETKLGAGHIPGAMEPLLQHELSRRTDRDLEILYVNTTNPVIQKLEKLEDSHRRELVLQLLLDMTLIFSGKTFSEGSGDATFQNFANILEELLR